MVVPRYLAPIKAASSPLTSLQENVKGTVFESTWVAVVVEWIMFLLNVYGEVLKMKGST